MGGITYQGTSPFRLIPAQASTARAVRNAVEMTVYGSVEGQSPDAFPVQVPMSIDDAQELVDELIASMEKAKRWRG
jgi:hypothetical protein